MKFKSVAIIVLAILGCSFAGAQTQQTYTFGFLSIEGEQYCNYELLQQFSSNSAIWQGLDVLDACNVWPIVEATLVGATAKVSGPSNPVRIPINGVFYADNIYDAANYGYTGIQWFVLTDLKPSTSKYGWVGFASYDGIIYGAEYGYLTTTLPDANTSKHILSTGQKAKPTKAQNSEQNTK